MGPGTEHQRSTCYAFGDGVGVPALGAGLGVAVTDGPASVRTETFNPFGFLGQDLESYGKPASGKEFIPGAIPFRIPSQTPSQTVESVSVFAKVQSWNPTVRHSFQHCDYHRRPCESGGIGSSAGFRNGPKTDWGKGRFPQSE